MLLAERTIFICTFRDGDASEISEALAQDKTSLEARSALDIRVKSCIRMPCL